MMEGQINALAKTSQPVVITGEEGCGKDQIARYLYIHSPLRNNSFIMIYCELINDKSWAFLINSSGSPFGENNQTYYFKNLDRLPDNKYRQLEFVLLEQSLPQRCLLYTSHIRRVDPLAHLHLGAVLLPALVDLEKIGK